jgi:acyl carrier protein
MEINEIQSLIFESMKMLNEQFPDEKQLELKSDTILFGKGAKLDSLGLVNLIVLVEENTLDKLGKSITLADERAMSQKSSPFRTVQSLSEYMMKLLSE